jgi:hypothetical protein
MAKSSGMSPLRFHPRHSFRQGRRTGLGQPRYVDLATIVRRVYAGPQNHFAAIPFRTRIVVLHRVHCVRRLAVDRTHCRCFTNARSLVQNGPK